MCLGYVTSKAKSVSKPLSVKIKTGWKLFVHDELHPKQVFSWCKDGGYKIGKWYTDKCKSKIGYFTEGYPTGYHVFTTRRAAEDRRHASYDSYHIRVMKVEYSHVVARGKENGETVVVARRMKILNKKV